MDADSPTLHILGAAPIQKRNILAVWTDSSTIAIFTTAGIFLHLILRYFLNAPKVVWQAPLIVVLLLGGVPLLLPLVRKLLAHEFGADHLAGISIITSVILGEYLVGAIVILMLSGGTAVVPGTPLNPESCTIRSKTGQPPTIVPQAVLRQCRRTFGGLQNGC
jgi:hypothetical protein